MRSETKRQKKLAKKRSKQVRDRRQLARTKQQMTSMAGQMQAASASPIHGCFAGTDPGGMQTIILARKVAGGRVAFGVFLLDLHCLGVKNGFGRIGTAADLDELLARVRETEGLEPYEPSRARKLVEDAIEYAAELGFSPHPDARKAMPIWGDIDSSECKETFEFGHEGQPFYVAGPHDSFARQKYIVAQLTEAVGEENFTYVLHLSGNPRDLADLDEDWEEDELMLE